MAFICAAHPARLSSRRRDGDNRVALIRHLQVRCVRRTLVDQAETGNTRISGRIRIMLAMSFASEELALA
jgi:hypothetical protein